MRGINSETIDLIATDPPFNKGRDFHATPDSLAKGAKFSDRWRWDEDVQPDWVESIKDEWPGAWAVIDWTRMTYGDDMGAFLCFMGVRLMEMHRLLKPTGSIYLHCDDTASAYLTALMDAVFGRDNRRAIITWKRTSAHNDAGDFGRVVDNILYYVKSAAAPKAQFRVPLDDEYVAKFYRHDDDDGRGPYQVDNLTGPKTTSGESSQPYKGFNPTERGRCWSVPLTGNYAEWIEQNYIPGYRSMPSILDRLAMLDEHGFVHWPKNGGTPRIKRYLASSAGQLVTNLWTDIPPVGPQAKESAKYPTQKPLRLYERIIQAGSNEGDWVLDPFAGCATTPLAAEMAGRRWIGIDLWDEAMQTTIERFQKTAKLAAADTAVNTMAIIGQLHHRTDVPERTDGGDAAAPYLATPTKGMRRRPLMGVTEMKELLVDKFWFHCWGCNFVAPDARYLELDHIRPRNSGGSDDIDNRALLCGPCNKIKRDHATLVSLRKANEKSGHLSGIHPINLKEAGRWTRQQYEAALAKRLNAET